jgi:HEAT repeat protein
LGNPEAFNVLMKALDAPEVVLQQAAIAALGEIGAINSVDKILTFAQAEDWLVRQRLAEALGKLDTPKSRSALNYLAKDAHAQVSQAARLSLEALTTRDHS